MLESLLVTEQCASTVEEAVELGLAELGCTRAEAEIDIRRMPRKRWFGLLGSRPAQVRVRLCDRGFIARRIASKLLRLSGLEGEVAVQPGSEAIGLEIRSAESSLIIGRHGQTLDALQYLTVALTDRINRDPEELTLDIDRYRQRRATSLTRLVHRLVARARRSGRPALTRPLSPEDRRLVHRLLESETDLEVRSTGQGIDRKMTISVRKG